MTVYAESEVKRIVQEVFSGFQDLRQRDLRDTRILYGTHDVDLIADLGKLNLDKKWAVPGPEMERWSHDAQRGTAVDLMFSIVPYQVRSAATADALEPGCAWAWNQLDAEKVLSETIVRVLCTRPYAGVWLLLNPFKPPTDEKLYEAYERAYFPLRAEVDTPQTTAFYEDHGRATLAVRCYEQTLANIATTFDKKPERRRRPMDIWAEDYEGYRNAFKTGEWTEKELYGAKLKVWHFDDGEHVYHCINMPGSGGSELVYVSTEKEDKPYDNPIGRPLFVWGSAYYNPDAELLSDRYRALLWPVYRKSYQRDQQTSLLMSYMADLHRIIVGLDKDALAEMQKLGSPKEKGEFVDTLMMREVGGAMVTFGVMKQLDMPMPEILGTQLRRTDIELQGLAPGQPPEEITQRYGTASGLVVREEYKEGQFSSARSALSRIAHGAVSVTLDLYRYSLTSRFKNVAGAIKTFDLWGAETGREYMKKRKAKPGRTVHLSAETLGPDDSWYELWIEPVDNSLSAKQARMGMANARRGAGLTTEYQWVEENDFLSPTEQLQLLEEEKLISGLESQLRAIAPAWATLAIAKDTGIDFGQLMQMFLGAAAPAATEVGKQVQTPQATFRMGSPEREQDQLEIG